MVILGECAEQYDGDKSATTFILLVDQLKTTLRVVGDQWLIKLNIPIIAELHHKDSTSSKTRRATLGNVAGRDKEKDKEGDKDRDYTPRERGKKTDLPALAILWNEHCPSLAKVKGTNPARNKKAAERLAESTQRNGFRCSKKSNLANSVKD